MEPKKTGKDPTYWHPAFYADIQIELAEDADNLIFENEHQLAVNPMEIDVLVIKKETSRPVKKNIGRIFRKYNIIEYKSPDDSLSIDDFYKVYGYACFYKADVPFADSIPIQELTITFVSEMYPRELIRHLKECRDYAVQKAENGIYYIHGDLIPIQVIVTKKLSHEKNLWLRSLTNKLSEAKNAKKLVADYMAHTDNRLYRSVLETIMWANRKTFEEVNNMGDIIMEIVQEKFDRKLKEEVEKATENLTEQLTKDITEQVTKDITEQVTKDVTEQVTKDVTKQVTKDVTRQVTKDVTRQVTKDVTRQVTKDVTRQVTKDVTEKTRTIERLSLILKKYIKNKPLAVIADELETDPDELFPLYDIVSKNPGKTVEELYKLAAG